MKKRIGNNVHDSLVGDVEACYLVIAINGEQCLRIELEIDER